MASIIKIGNSQGVRIPKPVVEQARLEDCELEFEVVEEGLLLKPLRTRRENWNYQIRETQRRYGDQPDEGVDEEFLNHEDDGEDWDW